MEGHAVRWRLVPLSHAIVAHDRRDAQAVVTEHDVPAHGLRLAMGMQLAPFLQRGLVPPVGEGNQFGRSTI